MTKEQPYNTPSVVKDMPKGAKFYLVKTTKTDDLGVVKDYYDIMFVAEEKAFVMGYKQFYTKKQRALIYGIIQRLFESA